MPATLPAPAEPYGYRMLGQVATLGHFKEMADVLGIPLSGFPGWFVGRSYHLYALLYLSRKLRVVADWTTALFFRRDLAELSNSRPPRRVRGVINLAPLYDIRLRTPRLELRLGMPDEIDALGRLAQQGIHPPEEMPFAVAWSDRIGEPTFPDEFRGYHAGLLTAWRPDAWRIDFLVWEHGSLVGAQGISGTDSRASEPSRRAHGGAQPTRDGESAPRCAPPRRSRWIFRGLGAVAATSGWLEGNASSARVSEKLGYREQERAR